MKTSDRTDLEKFLSVNQNGRQDVDRSVDRQSPEVGVR